MYVLHRAVEGSVRVYICSNSGHSVRTCIRMCVHACSVWDSVYVNSLYWAVFVLAVGLKSSGHAWYIYSICILLLFRLPL